MTERIFLALIGAQALHSLEEYLFDLWTVFPLANYLSGVVSTDLGRGFLILQIAVVVVGLLCYLGPVRRGWASATAIMWIWALIEVVNGVAHPAWSIMEGAYTPGVYTCLLILPLSILLIRRLAGSGPRRTQPS